MSDVIHLKDRATWQSGLQFVALIGDLVGGPMGGILVDRLGWRWYVNIDL